MTLLRRFTLAATLVLFVTSATVAEESKPPFETATEASSTELERGAEFGSLHPDAPPETAQFAFLVGEWDCKIRSMSPTGGWTENQATWTARYILDGWAIQDLWVSQIPGGGTLQGTNIRSFNPETRKWDNRWLGAGNLQWKYFESEMVEGKMVMIGGEGEDPRGAFVDRNTFHDVTDDSWTWRKDRSWDGGKTWLEGIAFIEAKRAR